MANNKIILNQIINMKRILALFFIFSIVGNLFADNWVNIKTSQPTDAVITLQNSDISKSVLSFKLEGYNSSPFKLNNKIYTEVSIPNGTPLLVEGAPDLQKITTSLIIPDEGKMEVKVISSKYKEYTDFEIAPSKGNLYRDVNPKDIPHTWGEEYQRDEFFPGEIAVLREPHILRDFRGQTVVICPFQYNPVTKVLRVYYDIVLEVSHTDVIGNNQLVRHSSLTKTSTAFRTLYSNHFINYEVAQSRYTPLDDHGNMLIISHGDFMDEMQPFIEWKTISGMPVEIVDVATIGGSTQIKQYISNYYNDNGLTFVLLVGDAAQVPSSSVSGNDSDNDYVYIVGNDHYPDAFIGRFSATAENHVITQVNRTIEYEKDPISDPDWYSEAIGIASAEGPGDDNEYDYQHMRNIGDDLLAFTYTYTYELFDGSQGGNDATGNPSPSDVAIAVNSGASIMNYTGHGSNTAWSTSGFSNSDIDNLTNVGKWPFIFDVACVNGNFVGLTCFAEAWLRAEDNGEPTGAIAVIMSTINQSWNPPMAGQDEMNDILTEQYPDNIKRTFAGCGINGCLLMNDEYGSAGDEMTDTWTVFGDPSVMVRTATPQDIIVTMPPAILLGTTEFTISCNAEDGLAVLSSDGEIISTAVVENGEATFGFDPMTEPGFVDIVITGFNYRPYIDQIDVIAAEGPYLLYADHTINDSIGNNNNKPECDEQIYLTIGIENLGVESGIGVESTISLNDQYTEIIDGYELYDSIPVNQTVYKDNGFKILLASDIPDQHEMNFTLTSVDANDSTWVSEFVVKACAPVLVANQLAIDDSQYGNNNGRLDAGETAILTINATNEGHSVAHNVTASLAAYNPYINVLSNDTIIPVMGLFGAYYPQFEVEVSEDAPEGVLAEMRFELICGAYLTQKSYYPKIGLIIEDWETGDFSKYNWQSDGDEPWIISNQYPYEGYYDVTSGVIGNNSTSELYIQYEVMSNDSISFYKKVSSEVDFDKLKFFIDNTLMDEWSGTSQSWTRESFAVSQGVHKFRWVYEKDYSTSSGADMAWIDYIELPTMMATTVYAGPDDESCEMEPYQCLGSATNYTSIQWETTGDGEFVNQQSLDAVYNPSSIDVSNGNVQLILNIVDVDGNSASDTMNLVFDLIPEKADVPEGPEIVDLQSVNESEYTTSNVPMADNYYWYISPEDAGFIAGSSTIGTVVWNQDFAGEAWISVAAGNYCGLGEVSDSLMVIVSNTVGLHDDEASNFKVFPNPSSGSFKITSNKSTNEAYDIKIIDSRGVVVIQVEGVKLSNSKNLNHDMPAGLYMIIIENETTRFLEKIVIK